jgi:TrmH family RNA methyltransferase
MISLRKLASLPEGTRHRKTLAVIRGYEEQLAAGDVVDIPFLTGLLRGLASDEFWSSAVRKDASDLADCMAESPTVYSEPELRRYLNRLGHDLASALGKEWADWDAIMPSDRLSGEHGSLSRPFRVYLDGLRSPFNVGSILRTSMAFNLERIWVSPDCAPPDHRRSIRSSMGAAEAVDWDVKDPGSLEDQISGTLFALELGGTPIEKFRFPSAGTVILGSEELGVRPELLDRAAADGGIVSIPLPGPKASLNVGVAFGILMEHWNRQIDRNAR